MSDFKNCLCNLNQTITSLNHSLQKLVYVLISHHGSPRSAIIRGKLEICSIVHALASPPDQTRCLLEVMNTLDRPQALACRIHTALPHCSSSSTMGACHSHSRSSSLVKSREAQAASNRIF